MYSETTDWQLVKQGDQAARARLAERYRGLVFYVAKRFIAAGIRGGMELEDLCGYGYIGLMYAIDRFDADRGCQFNTFATYCIRSEILHALRDGGRLIRLPAWIVDSRQEEGLPVAVAPYEDQGMEDMPAIEPDIVDTIAVRMALGKLPPRERYILKQIEMCGRSQAGLASELGYSQISISRFLRTAKERMKRYASFAA